jgi:hypothetical protein
MTLKWQKRRGWVRPLPKAAIAQGYKSLDAWRRRVRRLSKKRASRHRAENVGLTAPPGKRGCGFIVTWPDGTRAVWRAGEGVVAVD